MNSDSSDTEDYQEKPAEAAIFEGVYPFLVIGFLAIVGYVGYWSGIALVELFAESAWDSILAPILPYFGHIFAAGFVLFFAGQILMEVDDVE